MHIHIAEEKRKFLIIVLSGIVLFVLDIAFIVTPLINKTSDLKFQIIAIKKNISDLNKQISMLDAARKKLENLKSDQAVYEKRFPKEEEIPSLLESLSTIAARSSVDIIAVKPIKIETKEQMQETVGLFHEIPIEILARGGYHQLSQFINKLETLDRFIEVKDVEIAQDNTMPRRHFLKLLVSTYILRM